MDANLILLGEKAALVALTASAPLLAAALAVGLLTGVFQAVTQIQDPAPGIVLRLVAVLVTLAACGPWTGAVLLRFARLAMTAAFRVAR